MQLNFEISITVYSRYSDRFVLGFHLSTYPVWPSYYGKTYFNFENIDRKYSGGYISRKLEYTNRVFMMTEGSSNPYTLEASDCAGSSDPDIFICQSKTGGSFKTLGDSRILCFRNLFKGKSLDYCPINYELTIRKQCHHVSILGKKLAV